LSAAITTAEAPPAGLDLYRLRDELAQSYNPANALERMLVTRMAQPWLRLQRAQEAEERYFKAHDVLDAIANDYGRYKAITRLVADCERAWRHAMVHLEKAQRRRQQTGGFSPESVAQASACGAPVAQAAGCGAPPKPALEFQASRRLHPPPRTFARSPPAGPDRRHPRRPQEA
jgi:hypothetical protein